MVTGAAGSRGYTQRSPLLSVKYSLGFHCSPHTPTVSLTLVIVKLLKGGRVYFSLQFEGCSPAWWERRSGWSVRQLVTLHLQSGS